MKNSKYFFIVGINKAGTTSIFQYLKNNPNISTQVTKQNFYFLDKLWYNNHKEFVGPINDFRDDFSGFIDKFYDKKKVYMDSSPEYFFCPLALKRLKVFSENYSTKFYIIFRDPVERFVSLYKYHLQIGLIDKSIDFKTYINLSIKENSIYNIKFNGFLTSDYQKYYNEYKIAFGDSLKIGFFEDFIKSPAIEINNLLSFLEIEPMSLNHLSKVHNKSKFVSKNVKLTLIYTKIRFYLLKIMSSMNIGSKLVMFVSSIGSFLHRKLVMKENVFEPSDEEIKLVMKNVKVDYTTFKKNIMK